MNEWNKHKYSESQARVWKFVDDLTKLYLGAEHEEMRKIGTPDQNRIKELRDEYVKQLDAYSDEISDYSLEELVTVMSFIHSETNVRTLVATHPLTTRTLTEIQEKMNAKEK